MRFGGLKQVELSISIIDDESGNCLLLYFVLAGTVAAYWAALTASVYSSSDVIYRGYPC